MIVTRPLPPLLLGGDCLVELKRIPDESVDAVKAEGERCFQHRPGDPS